MNAYDTIRHHAAEIAKIAERIRGEATRDGRTEDADAMEAIAGDMQAIQAAEHQGWEQEAAEWAEMARGTIADIQDADEAGPHADAIADAIYGEE